MQRQSFSTSFPLGSQIPNFSLPNVDGNTITQDYFAGAKAALVVFTCNHCPYVKGSESMLLEDVRRYAPEGLKVVAISSNDAVQYPEDGPDKMKEKSQALGMTFPYLYDESQQVARSFDAACTPECYLFDVTGKLVFHGTINDSTINDNPKDGSQAQKRFLATAVEQLLAGRPVEPSFVHPMGCSIKWR